MKQATVIRILIVALPAGLLLLGIGAMLKTHMSSSEKPFDPNEDIRLEAASLNRKPVNRADLESYLETLSGRIGERNVGVPDRLESAAVWIESTLGGGNIGYKVERQTYETQGVEVRNLIAELPGRALRDEIVVVGAHYDTVPGCPGANDNGTGIAGVLALAQAFAGDPQARTIRFVAFVNEEPPFFHTDQMGSYVYAKRCQSLDEKIVAMISLETIGYFSDEPGSQEYPAGLAGQYPSEGNFLALVGNQASRYIVDSAEAAFSGAVDLPVVAGAFPGEVPGVAWSDHWSFWQAGYPAIMITDTAPFRYPHYHQPTDTVDKIDLDRFTEAVKGLEAVVRTWAGGGG
ncbi:MAG: M28 family peptidase [Verrucomicrobiales bacterium]